MKLRNSIAFPIIGLILFLITLTTVCHYYIQVQLLRQTLTAENRGKAQDIHFVIQSLVNKEAEKITALSKSLKEFHDLNKKIGQYIISSSGFETIKQIIDRLYHESNVDIFEVTDREGRVLYRAHDPMRRGDYADQWGTIEALDGRELLVTSKSTEGWGIRANLPVMLDRQVHGTIIVGTKIDDAFAREIAKATGVTISLGSVKGLIASSLPERDRGETDFETLILSLTENREISVEYSQDNKMILYAPLQVVDEVFGFMVEIDTTDEYLLFEQHKRQIIILFIVILFIAVAVGVGLTIYLIWPLNKLTGKAVETVKDISGDEIWLHKGNEVNQLVHSFDRMIRKVTDYLNERKKAEDELLEEKERLTITLRSIGDAVITTDVDGRIYLFNKAAEEITGWSQAEASGKHVNEVYRTIDEKTRTKSANPVETILGEGSYTSLTNQALLVARNGIERSIFESAASIRDKTGKIFGVVLVFRDLTEQKRMEEEHLKTKKLESLGVLAGGIAHDFNNILTAIMGHTSLATKLIDQGSIAQQSLIEINKASHRAQDLTQKLLTFSKGGAPVKEAAVTQELIMDSANFILSGTSTKCEFSLPEDLWSADVDKGQISQVIQNLCLNGHEAMGEGGTIQISAENLVVTAADALPLSPGNYIWISFADHGTGIASENLPKIFDPYFSTKQQGDGLGLATVHSIIKNHDGYVKVQSEETAGSLFIVYLPASPEKKVVKKEKITEEPIGGNEKILLMDDEELVCEVVGGMLKHLGYDVEIVRDGAEALALYGKAKDSGKSFDVVIMDLTIPGGMGGKEAIAKMIEIDPEVKAIVASGYSNDLVMAEFEKYGFKDLITKPFDVLTLSKAIKKVLAA